MSRFFIFKKVESKEEFNNLVCNYEKKLWNGDSVWAIMKFFEGTCYYYVCVKGEKMSKLAVKLVHQYVMTDECCMFASQTTKK